MAVNETVNLNIEFIDEFLRRMSNFGFSGTVLIAKGDNILLNGAYGYRNFEKQLRMETQTALSTGSISKQFTSTVVMKLFEENKISLQDNLSKFFPTIPEDKAGITIHQLLTHRAGLPSAVGDDFESISKSDYLNKVFSSNLETKPGTMYSYSNVGYSLLAIITEILTEVPYKSYLSNLLHQVGIQNFGWFGDHLWNEDNSVSYYLDGENTGSISTWRRDGQENEQYWHIVGNGGVCLSAHDLYIWIRAVMTGKIVSKDSLRLMTTPKEGDYAYGWRMANSEFGRIIRHNGGSDLGVNSVAQYYEVEQITIIIFSNTVQNGFGTGFQFENILNDIIRGKHVELPPMISSKEFEFASKKIPVENSTIFCKTNDLGQKYVGTTGQYLLNQIFQLPRERYEIFDTCNNIVEEYGKHILNENYEKVFQLTTRKEVDGSRVGFLKILIQEVINKIGEKLEVRVDGTIPGYDHHAMSFLMFTNDLERIGIPVIWANDNEILGIRPMFAEFALIFVIGRTNDNKYVGYNGLYNIQFDFSQYLQIK